MVTKLPIMKNNSGAKNDVLQYIVDDYSPIQESFEPGKNVFLSYFSEYKINNNLFRAHCNYRSEGPWYDWVMIRWESNSRTKQAKKSIARMSCWTY